MSACWRTTSRKPFWIRTSWQQAQTGAAACRIDTFVKQAECIICLQSFFLGIVHRSLHVFFFFLLKTNGYPAVWPGPSPHLPTGRRHTRFWPAKEGGASFSAHWHNNDKNRKLCWQLLGLCDPCGPCDSSPLLLHLASQVSPLLTSEVHSVRAGRHLATKLNILVQQHFDLASTTITNIPMKVRPLSPSVPPWTCLAHAP